MTLRKVFLPAKDPEIPIFSGERVWVEILSGSIGRIDNYCVAADIHGLDYNDIIDIETLTKLGSRRRVK
jgi:hypothetical protein